jgi:hypothetical protein
VCELVEKDQRQTSLAPNGSFETSKMSLALWLGTKQDWSLKGTLKLKD